jgi:hypothetical protein
MCPRERVILGLVFVSGPRVREVEVRSEGVEPLEEVAVRVMLDELVEEGVAEDRVLPGGAFGFTAERHGVG